jgi:hypothetical protein
MDSADSNARIVLIRERGRWRDRFRSYAVMVDEKEVGQVRRGERLDTRRAGARRPRRR